MNEPRMEPGALLECVANGGERHLPAEDPESVNHYRHLTAYRFALPLVRGRRVLEYGCGAGYGTNLLACRGETERLVACDVHEPSLRYCREAYGPRLLGRLARVAPGELPVRPASFDAVLLFQTIEHVQDDVALLRELRRALRPGGWLLVTTPNVAASGGDPDHPDNPFHVREYDRTRLAAACRAAGLQVEELFVHGSFRTGGGGLGLERLLAFRALRKLWRVVAPRPVYVPPVSLADFGVSPRGAARALDLLFRCHGPS
jgi:SAM-dependent methyltransferase